MFGRLYLAKEGKKILTVQKFTFIAMLAQKCHLYRRAFKFFPLRDFC